MVEVDRSVALQILQRTDGKNLFIKNELGLITGPRPTAIQNGNVNVVAEAICLVVARDNAGNDMWMPPSEVGNPRHQPVVGKRQIGRDSQISGRLAPADLARRLGNQLQRHPYRSKQPGPGRGERYLAVLTVEQHDPEIRFEHPDLLAHRRLADTQLATGVSKVFQSTGRFKDLER